MKISIFRKSSIFIMILKPGVKPPKAGFTPASRREREEEEILEAGSGLGGTWECESWRREGCRSRARKSVNFLVWFLCNLTAKGWVLSVVPYKWSIRGRLLTSNRQNKHHGSSYSLLYRERAETILRWDRESSELKVH